MFTVTVSDKGPLVIAAAVRKRFGMCPGTKLAFVPVDDAIHFRRLEQAKPTREPDGSGIRVCEEPERRHQLGFDVADAMRRVTA